MGEVKETARVLECWFGKLCVRVRGECLFSIDEGELHPSFHWTVVIAAVFRSRLADYVTGHAQGYSSAACECCRFSDLEADVHCCPERTATDLEE